MNMTSEGERIFNANESDEWITYSITTAADRKRVIGWGAYTYDAEDEDSGKPWRIVYEDVSFDLDEFVAMIGKQDPQQTARYYNRCCDGIDDVTEEQAREWFVSTYDFTPKLDMEYITAATPDGMYIGRYKGLRVRT